MSGSSGSGSRRIRVDAVVPARGDPRPVGGLLVGAGVVEAVEPAPGGGEGAQRVALCPLANAHDHGRPYGPDHYGARDDSLEVWLAGLAALPALEPYLTAAAALGQAARGGVSSVVHVHDPNDSRDIVSEARQVMRAAADVGVRMAFVVPVMDRDHSVYGRAEDLMERIPVRRRSAAAKRWGGPRPPLGQQLEWVEAIAEAAPDLVDVQIGPTAPQWCSDETLRAVAELSDATGRRVHMHLLESIRQRQWADAAFPGGIVGHLDDLGLLSPRLAVAHGVWLRPAELDVLADRGVAVVANTSSNLRLRSGVAPVRDFAAAGVGAALGLDSLPLLEPGDMAAEWELGRIVHRVGDGTALDHWLREAAVVGGHAVAGFPRPGELAEGCPADVAVMAWDSAADGPLSGDAVWAELRRRGGAGVEDLFVAGRPVMAGGKMVTVDEEGLFEELDRAIARSTGGRHRAADPLTDDYRNAVRRFYRDGCHLHDDRGGPGAGRERQPTGER